MAGLIAPESRRLLREAMQAKRQGFGNVAENLAAQSYIKKGEEAPIPNQESTWALQDLAKSKGYGISQEAQRQADERLAGRQAFAQELTDRATAENQPAGFDLRTFAEPRAKELGISQAALTSFFQRNKLPMTAPATAITQNQPTAESSLTPSSTSLEVVDALLSDLDKKKQKPSVNTNTVQPSLMPNYVGIYNG